MLQSLGIDHIEYHPYYPGSKNVSRIPLAITPGEISLVPQFVEEIVDIGPRLIDITSVMEILAHLNLLEQRGAEISTKYTRKIIDLSKNLAQANRESNQLNKHFKQVLDGVDNGILAVDIKGRITIFNEMLETHLKVTAKQAIGRLLKDVLPNHELVQFILQESSEESRVFTLLQNEFIVQRFHLKTEESIVATFKNMNETIKMERTLRRELVKKGFVAKYNFQDIIGQSAKIEHTKSISAKLSRTDLTVLIEGESGTGKELFASAIHNASFRNQGPFLAMNFSSLPEDLMESELFGYEDGAFTGARKGGKSGLFEQANGGTIFLDEIGDISLKLQARLLRVLQEKEIMRIGGGKIIPLDVRVIAATNKDLLQMIELGKFREDLYHRLKVLYLHLPELRNRKDDIPPLIQYFMEMNGRNHMKLLPEVMHHLTQYEWYGNIRELKNTIDYMLAVCDNDTITLLDIPDSSFFQRSGPGSKGDLIYRTTATLPEHASSQTATGAVESEELLFIMQTIYAFNKSGEPIGRKKISEQTKQIGKELSEQQIRHRFEMLEQQGYIIIHRGRTGVKLSQLGLTWLNAQQTDKLAWFLLPPDMIRHCSNFQEGGVFLNTASIQSIEKAEKYGAHNYHPLPIVISKAEGIWAEDPEGNRYMDMLSAYSALNHGHRHPKIIQALKDQADKVTLTSRAFHNEQLGLFYEKLAAYTGKPMILPMNTGAEAVETALKAVRRWAYDVKKVPDGQAEIIVCEGNFHGRTVTITSFSSSESYKRGFGPFTPGFRIIPYGDLDALKAAIQPNTAGFLVEPIQGEAGILIPQDGFLQAAYQLCQENQVLFVADEIQTGFGRTGKRFACDWENVIPDIYIMGKALGGGVFPISAVAAEREILGVFEPGSHGSTFGGNPLGCAVAVAALDVLQSEGLAERSEQLGKYFLNRLKEIRHPLITEVRGRGLFIGLELSVSARPYCESLKNVGLLCKETHDNIIRFAPPLIITKDELDWAWLKINSIFQASHNIKY
ncbi:unnamed protein product [Aphanomyces euteiches]